MIVRRTEYEISTIFISKEKLREMISLVVAREALLCIADQDRFHNAVPWEVTAHAHI